MKCFVIAMQKEATPLMEAMQIEKDYTVCNKRVVLGSVFGKEIAIVVSGVGKVNAASGTQYAIDCLGATEIINIGVAGGLNGTVEVGEIYSVSAVVQYDFDLVQINGGKIGTLSGFTENYLPLTPSKGFELKRVGTGDRFNDDYKDFLLLTEELGADIREMELGAIAQVCIHAGVECRSFKIISDLAGSGSTTDQYIKNLDICFASMRKNLEKIINAV